MVWLSSSSVAPPVPTMTSSRLSDADGAVKLWNRIPESERQKVIEYALAQPWMSRREVAVDYTVEKGYFVSESSVYRILKAAGLVSSPAYALQSAKNEFQHKTTRVNELWQTDFTYFRIVGWGRYYLSTASDVTG